MIFPKKEILYAPMLGTLGGGSMRSFGRGTGGGGPGFIPDFSGSSTYIYTGSNTTFAKIQAANFTSSSGLTINTNFNLTGAFPAQVMDVAFAYDDPTYLRIIARTSVSNDISTMPLNFSSSTSPTQNVASSYIGNVRALMMCRNGYFVHNNISTNSLVSWKLKTDGYLNLQDSLADMVNLVRLQIEYIFYLMDQ